MPSVDLSRRWWRENRPESVPGRKLEGALERYERLLHDAEHGGGADSDALLDALERLDGAAEETAKECMRQGERETAQDLRDLARLIAREKKEARRGGCGDDDDGDDVPGGLALDAETLRKHMRLLAKGPLPFAFGLGSGGAGCLVLDRKRKGASLMAKLKQASGCKSATFGVAALEEGVLVLAVEGPTLSGLAKRVRQCLKENQPLPTTRARVRGEADDDERPEDQEQQDDPPLNMTRPYEISGSVGAGGRNSPEDVEAVQTQLNRRGARIDVDGRMGPKTIEAIRAFQRSLGFARADGLVEPGKTTDRALRGEKVQPPKPQGGGGAPKAPPRERTPREVERPEVPGGGERVGVSAAEGPATDHLEQAKALARRLLERKQSADKRMEDLRRAAAAKPGQDSEKIVGRLEENYGRHAQGVQEVSRRVKEIARADGQVGHAERERRVVELERLARAAMEGFESVETGAGKGVTWIETRTRGIDVTE